MSVTMQGNLAILAGYLVFFAATIDVLLAAVVAILVVVAFSLVKVRQGRK